MGDILEFKRPAKKRVFVDTTKSDEMAIDIAKTFVALAGLMLAYYLSKNIEATQWRMW